jgi:hypothetical protein
MDLSCDSLPSGFPIKPFVRTLHYRVIFILVVCQRESRSFSALNLAAILAPIDIKVWDICGHLWLGTTKESAMTSRRKCAW